LRPKAGLPITALLAVSAALVAGTGRVGLLHELDFERGGALRALGLTPSGNDTGRIVEVDGERAVMLALSHDDPVTYRTELTVRGLPEPDFIDGSAARLGHGYWYGLRLYLPAGWEPDSTPEIITQWHEIPDRDLGEAWRNPPVALQIKPAGDGAPHFVVRVRSDSRPLTVSGRYERDEAHDLGPVAPFLGRWTNWVWSIRWAADDTGHLTLWRDGVKVLDLPNQGNTYNDARGPYMKIGIYKWAWQDPRDTGARSRVLYVDDIRIGNGSASYDTVAPKVAAQPQRTR